MLVHNTVSFTNLIFLSPCFTLLLKCYLLQDNKDIPPEGLFLPFLKHIFFSKVLVWENNCMRVSRGWKTCREQKTGGMVECATFLHPRHLRLGSCRHQEKTFITTQGTQAGWRVKYLLGRFFLKIKTSSVSLQKLSLWMSSSWSLKSWT